MSFNTLGLSSELKKAIEDKGYIYPSDIQLQAIPSIIKGDDIMARAQTGTGKTAAFALPILQKFQKDLRSFDLDDLKAYRELPQQYPLLF